MFVNTGFNYNTDSSHMYKMISNDKVKLFLYEKTTNGHGYAQAIWDKSRWII